MLKEYREKRHFEKTPEPAGQKSGSGEEPIFVIQQHASSHLHYDLRLEAKGVLKSWAVPKGPPTDLTEKRLAMETEDHPLEYAQFEGTIPKGEYGAGTVKIWDHGSYRHIPRKDSKAKSPAKAIEEGHIVVWMNGEKMKGPYALTRTGGADTRRWILIKMREEKALWSH